MQDDSVTVPGAGRPEYAGKSVTRRAEDFARSRESGRIHEVEEGASQRPRGRSTPRHYTSVAPQPPIERQMPTLSTP